MGELMKKNKSLNVNNLEIWEERKFNVLDDDIKKKNVWYWKRKLIFLLSNTSIKRVTLDFLF